MAVVAYPIRLVLVAFALTIIMALIVCITY
jgi:hypothetical protein